MPYGGNQHAQSKIHVKHNRFNKTNSKCKPPLEQKTHTHTHKRKVPVEHATQNLADVPSTSKHSKQAWSIHHCTLYNHKK